jgi:hypothetical protein
MPKVEWIDQRPEESLRGEGNSRAVDRQEIFGPLWATEQNGIFCRSKTGQIIA